MEEAGVIYYGDRSQVAADEAHPPSRDVQVILQAHPHVGWSLQTGADYYVRRPDGHWSGVDIFGLMDFLMDTGLVLFGRMINNEEYQAILSGALADRGDRKYGWAPGEKKPE